MSGEALASVPEDPAPPPPRRGWPIFGALLALLVSGGLVWWLARPDTPAQAPAAVVPRVAKVVLRAGPAADPAQVQRAFEAVQDAYADGGADGLARGDADCAAALKADARVLDYCLAFDLFATAVAPEIARADPDAARIAQAQAALPPGTDPAQRVAQVRVLMRQASLGTAAPAQRAAAPEPPAPAHARPAPPVRLAVAEPARPVVRHPTGRLAEQRRAAARAAVRALFARAEAAHEAAGDADAIAQIYAERTRPPEAPRARPSDDGTAPH